MTRLNLSLLPMVDLWLKITEEDLLLGYDMYEHSLTFICFCDGVRTPIIASAVESRLDS